MRRVLYHSAFVLAVCALLALWVPGASAQIIEHQTLHGFCGATWAGSTCSDNGTITPTSDNPLTQFGFRRDPHSNSGLINPTITLGFLVPDTNSGFTFGAFDSGTTTGSPTNVTPSLFSTTAWTSGELIEGYLGYVQTGGAANPIDAFLPSTQALDAGATGYFVYLAAFGAVDFTNDPVFTDNTTLPIGTVIVALAQWTGVADSSGNVPSKGKTSCTTGLTCVQDSSPPSAAILITDDGGGGGGGGPVPEPASIVLLGSVSVLIAGIWRKKVSAR